MPSRPPVFRPKGSATRAQQRRTEDRWRGSRHARGYDAAWDRLRAWRLSVEPLCLACRAKGRVTAATVVDHIRRFRSKTGEISDALRLDPENTQSLCHDCHAEKTAAERRED